MGGEIERVRQEPPIDSKFAGMPTNGLSMAQAGYANVEEARLAAAKLQTRRGYLIRDAGFSISTEQIKVNGNPQGHRVYIFPVEPKSTVGDQRGRVLRIVNEYRMNGDPALSAHIEEKPYGSGS